MEADDGPQDGKRVERIAWFEDGVNEDGCQEGNVGSDEGANSPCGQAGGGFQPAEAQRNPPERKAPAEKVSPTMAAKRYLFDC